MVEKKWDQSHLVIATLSQLFESANDVKVGINNHRQLMRLKVSGLPLTSYGNVNVASSWDIGELVWNW